MKKDILILLLILTACGAIRKIESPQLTDPKSFDSTIKKSEMDSSAIQDKTFVSIKYFSRDTLRYIRYNFIDKKQKYIGKDLNNLLKDVEIPIRSYIYGRSVRNFNIMKNMTLQFYSSLEARKRANSSRKPVDIIIVWLHPLPMDSANILLNKNRSEWTDDERNYFGKLKIGDILTTDWNL